jgi:hypothetical protein
MMERGNTTALSTAMDTPIVQAGMSVGIDVAGQGVRLIRRLVATNLALVAIQAISAGFFLSGYGRAVTVHVAAALALELGALIQAITAIVLWRRGRVPARVVGLGIGLFVMVMLQVALGYTKQFWLHVPLGVGLFGGLIRQARLLDGTHPER